jgi:hypothetical protein
MKTFRLPAEEVAGRNLARIFESSGDSLEEKLENFPKYVRRQKLKRFLALYEVFKLALPVKGSVVDCGVYKGFSLMSWAKLSAMLEPENLTRRIYGFDTFRGFPTSSSQDGNSTSTPQPGELASDSHDELLELIAEFDRDRFLGHIQKVYLVRGDMSATIPEFVADNPHLVVSLLFLDADLFEATGAALRHFVPRMPRGAVIAFDELDNPQWPGETLALLDEIGIGKLRLRRMEWDPYISWAQVGE